MCWRCGAIRPYDGHGVAGAVLRPGYVYRLPDGREVEAVEVFVTDEKEILRLIDADVVADFDDCISWEDLKAFPPFDSPFFK